MRFHINFDRISEIGGWVAPDNVLAISRVYISVDGRRIADVSATKIGENIRNFGWHSTGQCIFAITEKEVPDLKKIKHLEIYDSETNVLVHRRAPKDGLLNEKVLLINTSIYSEFAIQSALFPYFRQHYFGLERTSDEVLTSILNPQTPSSVLYSGAILMPRFEGEIAQADMIVALLVHDPFVEMATRLIWLRERAELADDPKQIWRLGEHLEAASFVRDYELSNQKSLKRLFRMMPESVYRLLFNPLTRQLSTRSHDEHIRPGHSINAVETLSRIAIVGHADYFEAFVMTLFDRFGIEAPMPKRPPLSEEALALASELRSLKPALDMLGFDSVINDAVRNSVAKSWDA